MIKAFLMSVLVLATATAFAAQSYQSVPKCTAENEGQTLMLEDGMGSAVVYVCQKGAWVPASYAK